MNEVTLSLLNDEIKDEFERLRDLEVGCEQYKVAVDGLSKLVDRQIEIEKFKIDNANKVKAQEDELNLKREQIENQKIENDLKREQMKKESRDQIVKNVLTGVSVIGGFALTVWGTRASFKFEETGTVTTIMGRGFINKLLPKK